MMALDITLYMRLDTTGNTAFEMAPGTIFIRYNHAE